MIRLYGPHIGSAIRNHWLLCELGLEYESVELDITAGENLDAFFLKLNPNGQVPVLQDDDFVIYESLAINSYLAEKYQIGLLGKNIRDKALINQWSLWAIHGPQRYFSEIIRQKSSKDPDFGSIQRALEKLTKPLQILEKQLDNSYYLIGNQLSLADINVASSILYGELVDFDFSACPNIIRWLESLIARPAYQLAKGEEEFTQSNSRPQVG